MISNVFQILQEGYQTFRGGFWNYFSVGKNFALWHIIGIWNLDYKLFVWLVITSLISFTAGMDAQVSYAFHSQRKLHPEEFKNQLANQVYIPCS